jgi:hypothetical protein
MKLLKILLAALLTLSSVSAIQPPADDAPLVDVGLTMAVTGENGWYVSDVDIYAVSPVVANGQLLQTGNKLTISAEGEQEIEFTTPNGQNTAAQIVRIDKTPPEVYLVTQVNAEVTASYSDLQAEISDAGSGVCLVELSTDYGSSWTGFPVDKPSANVTWGYFSGFPEFKEGGQVVNVRARDCAGNISVAKILVVQVRE